MQRVPRMLKAWLFEVGLKDRETHRGLGIMPVSGETNKYNERNQGDDFKLPPCTVPLQSVLEQRLMASESKMHVLPTAICL